jgi:uncharacterized protein YpmS
VSIDQALKRGRRKAEALMKDTVRITRKSSAPVTDPVTGVVTFPETAVYEGKGYIQVGNSQGGSTETPTSEVTILRSRVHVPHWVDIRVDDKVVVVESPESPLLVGIEYNAVELLHKSRATAHRARIEEVA